MYIFTNKKQFSSKSCGIDKYFWLSLHVFMYSTCCKYVLQSLHRLDSGFHFLIPDLKRSIVSTSFIIPGILSQIFGPNYLILSFQ